MGRNLLIVIFLIGTVLIGFLAYNMHHTETGDLQEKGSEATSSDIFSPQSSSSNEIPAGGNYSLEELMKSRPDYFGFGLYSKPSYPDGIFKKAVHHINGSFSGYILLANAKGNDYIVFILLDYREVPFYLNGTLNITHHVVLGDMEYRFFKFEIPNISEGWHDVFVGVFPSPYSTEEQDPHLLYGFRLQLISGNPILELPSFEHPSVCTRNNTGLDAYLLLTEKPCDNTVWYKASLKADLTLPYFAVVGNTQDNLQTFALVQLLDYKQVPIGNRTVYFGYLYRNEIVSIPLSINVPKNGMHRLVLLYFAYPYEPLDYPPGVENVNLRLINEQSNVLILYVG
ncbi:hypothetical protein [Thermococcus camini]|uniref:Uncharacterized protein n=1 Tax=Thermococcus camini TaxID=2016373 RepID=A0A7G2DBB9_9EURY|nr:hypothetical protein [Thermococcus camini]CAD5245222.1 protein of unknown function [Thermococcus camini]